MKAEATSTKSVEQRRLAAIMFTDMVDFSRQMGADEAHTLRLLAIHNQVIEHAVAAHQGHVIKTAGDGFLIEFSSVVHAVQCAQSIQTHFHTHNAKQAKADQIHVRIGLHEGDILVQSNGDVLGDGVNIASRLQTLAEPDTICISQKVHEEVEKKLDLGTVLSLGQPNLKNIVQRQHVYLLLPEPPTGLRQALQVQRLKLRRRMRPIHWLGVAALFLIVGTLVTVRYFPVLLPSTQPLAPSTQPLPLPDKPSIVVLPFDNMSKDPEQDYFSNGITEVLTSDLSRISSLFVIARNTAFTYKGKALNVQEVGKELGVQYVLEGSVQKAADHVRIVAQLIDTTTGGHLWSQRYDRPLKDIFALQDEIVQKIVTTLELQLTLSEQGVLTRKRTDNLEAYDYFLRGLVAYEYRTKETNAQARQMFEKAIALDPQYATAYAQMGWTHLLEWSWRWSVDPKHVERAFELAQQAIALDGSLPGAHSLLSSAYASKKQYDPAIAEGERAIALDPNNSDSYVRQAEVLSLSGKPEEASRLVEQAMRLNPRYPVLYLFNAGWAYTMVGRYAEAITALKTALLRNPDNLAASFWLAGSYGWQWASQLSLDPQTLERGLEVAQRAVALNDSYWAAHWFLSFVYLHQQQYDHALVEIERAVALDSNEAGSYAFLAEVLSRVGRSEEALGAAEKALHLKPIMVAVHLHYIGTAYYLAGQTEDAVAPIKQFLTHYPNILGAHLTLAAVYSELGKEVEARAEAAEVLRINSKFSLEVHKERAPIKDLAMLERHIAALRKAGLK
jgi:adenylate cyclase